MSELKVGGRARIARWGASGFIHDFDGCSGTEGYIDEISPNGATVLKTSKGVRYGDISGLEPIPATSEEIAAYKEKYEAEDLIGISEDDADTKFSETFSKPKTYTLTPYIKPETVTINGVEYIMTENV